jgi:hypothetical protein
MHATQPRRKLIVCVDAQEFPEMPEPVKITHVQENPEQPSTPPWE